MPFELNAPNVELEQPYLFIRHAFQFVLFFFTEVISTSEEILRRLIGVLSIFNINDPEDLVLWLLSASSVVFILSKLGWLPPKIDKAINRNQRSEIRTALELLGVNEAEIRSRFRSLKFQTTKEVKTVEESVTAFAMEHKKEMRVLVGSTQPVHENCFIDLMSASTSHKKAMRMATLIKTFIGQKSKEVNHKNITDFDYVATPKSGSPMLGYEFSRITDKPLLLHSMEEKYLREDNKIDPESHFDFDCEIVSGKKVLIVDDSSTGGRKMKRLVDDLKGLGLNVDYCVVLFEPQSKVKMQNNAANLLSTAGVSLVSVIKYP